jgi:hypothetical protein
MLKQTDSITLIIDGTEVSSWLPPYLWMYPNPTAKLAIDARIDGGKGGSARLTSDKLFSEVTEGDVRELLAKTKIIQCKKCGKPAFDPSGMDTNREGMCEQCFLEKLNAEYKKAAAKESKRKAAKDKRMFTKGYRFRIEAWIHPAAGGDDYTLEMYSVGGMSKAEIQRELKKEGSRKLDDYTVTKLEG